jgi:hypothetical protein
MNKKYIETLLIVAAGVAFYFLVYKKLLSPAAKSREFLHTLGFGIADAMNDNEVNDAATYIRDYTQKGKKLIPGSALEERINAIANKYKIFNV